MSLAHDAAGELTRLVANARVRGVREAAGQELRTEKAYIGASASPGQTIRRAAQSGSQLVGVMLTITLAAAIGFVGTKVTSEIDDSITDRDLSTVDDKNQTVYENSTESIGGGFADAMGLTDIVFLILMFGVILGALLAFRGRR